MSRAVPRGNCCEFLGEFVFSMNSRPNIVTDSTKTNAFGWPLQSLDSCLDDVALRPLLQAAVSATLDECGVAVAHQRELQQILFGPTADVRPDHTERAI